MPRPRAVQEPIDEPEYSEEPTARAPRRSSRDKAMSKTEAAKNKPYVVEMIADSFMYLDQGLTATNARGLRADIWSNADDEEIEVLADVWLERSQRSVVVARALRAALDNWRYVQAAVILAPRMGQTVAFYAGAGFTLPFPTPKRRSARGAARAVPVPIEQTPAAPRATAPAPAPAPATNQGAPAEERVTRNHAEAEEAHTRHMASLAARRVPVEPVESLAALDVPQTAPVGVAPVETVEEYPA